MKRPVRVMFLEHQFVVGGAERVLANLLESFCSLRTIRTRPGRWGRQVGAE